MVSRTRSAWIVALLAFAVPVAFACFTDHVWEDYLITLRASRNLVLGNGLVFTPGERLHTFTSPLGVLIPALLTWISGPAHEALALWLFRLLSAGLLAAGAALAWERFRSLGLKPFAIGTALLLLFVDPKLADFATNGMETGIMVFLVLALWSELERPAGTRIVRVGVLCGVLQWTRPDAFIAGAALILPHLVFRGNLTSTWRFPWRRLLAIAGIALAIYGPWLAFATWYYGSPIPHTIVAKSTLTPQVHWQTLLLIPWYTLRGLSSFEDVFLPTYWYYGGWPAALPRFAWIASTIAAYAWVVPKLPAHVRRVSLAGFIGMFYVCSIILFPWYSPPWTAIAALALGGVVDALLQLAAARQQRWLASATRVAAALAVSIQIAALAAASWEMRVQQRLVEDGGRHAIGTWLHEHAAPTDTVMLEPLGYIGYYSQLKTFDYPGLSSAEVTAVIRSGARRFTEVIDHLHPIWIVVRPFEIADSSLPQNAIWRHYHLVKTWDAHPALDQVNFLPGRPWLEHDAAFRVYRYDGQ